MIYYSFIAIYIVILIHVLYQDLISKYILVWSFYLFIIFSTIYYYLEYSSIIWTSILGLYILIVLILDIIEYFYGTIKAIWENWMFMWTWIFDYFLYIFIWNIIITEIIQWLWNITPIIIIFTSFLSTVFFWLILLYIHNSKVALLIENNNLKTYEDIDKLLYKWDLSKISILDLYSNKNKIIKNQELLWIYKKRIPLYLFWSVFIISIIILNLIKWI